MGVIIKIREGIDEYYAKTGHNPSKIIMTEYVLNKMKKDIKHLHLVPRLLLHEEIQCKHSDLEICGIPILVIYGNSTAITYE